MLQPICGLRSHGSDHLLFNAGYQNQSAEVTPRTSFGLDQKLDNDRPTNVARLYSRLLSLRQVLSS